MSVQDNLRSESDECLKGQLSQEKFKPESSRYKDEDGNDEKLPLVQHVLCTQ